jgi:negative regulator of flagellin synthesis FlgM
MKVTGKTSVDPKLVQGSDTAKDTKKVSKETSVGKDSAKVSKKDSADASESAKVTLSQKAQDFKKIKEVADKSDGVDAAKVERVKQAIKDGKYNIDYDKVADKMIESDIMHGA